MRPIASFRPQPCDFRPCDSDCLPPDRGDARFFQRTGMFAPLGKQKKRGRSPSGGMSSLGDGGLNPRGGELYKIGLQDWTSREW